MSFFGLLGSQFRSRSTSDTWIFRTLAIEDPAFCNDAFIISKASEVC